MKSERDEKYFSSRKFLASRIFSNWCSQILIISNNNNNNNQGSRNTDIWKESFSMTLDYLTTLIHGTIPSVLLLFITTKYKYIKTPFNIKFIIFSNIQYYIWSNYTFSPKLGLNLILSVMKFLFSRHRSEKDHLCNKDTRLHGYLSLCLTKYVELNNISQTHTNYHTHEHIHT